MDTFKKYVWNKNTIRKIVNKLFEKTPRHMVVSRAYRNYLQDEPTIIKFLRDRGVRPV
jgi:methylmalonyl-CoA mutase cobalamin-binding subunit